MSDLFDGLDEGTYVWRRMRGGWTGVTGLRLRLRIDDWWTCWEVLML